MNVLFVGQDESVCTAPYVPNGRAEAELAQYYPDGRTVTFVCNQGFAFEGVTYARCVQGNWILPVCKSKCRHTSNVSEQNCSAAVGERAA